MLLKVKTALLYFLFTRLLLVSAIFFCETKLIKTQRIEDLANCPSLDVLTKERIDCSFKYYKKLTTSISNNLDNPKLSLTKQLSFLDIFKSFNLYEGQSKITDTSLIIFSLLNSRPTLKKISVCILLTNISVQGNNGTLPYCIWPRIFKVPHYV